MSPNLPLARPQSWKSCLVVAVAALMLTPVARAEVCNIKVVTDANPDYSDIGSLIHSATGNWPETKDKCWAIFYWNHIARRQTSPQSLHGMELTDPIRQFNDYGYTMCSTVSGTNCAIWGAMGLNVKFWDISNHTVAEVEHDGKFNMYDSSMSALYTTCDGKALAGVDEIGAEGACEKSGGKSEPGHIARYHCLYATSNNGFLEGADTNRSVAEEYRCFNPNGLKYRYYFNSWDLGHRYILNLRDGEVYTRHYARQDAKSPGAVAQGRSGQYKADPAYYVPNGANDDGTPRDPEAANPRYRIRGNGVRTWTPILDEAHQLGALYSAKNVKAVTGGGLQPATTDPGEAVFKVEGANVITSLKITAELDGAVALAISTSNGKDWTDLKVEGTKADLKLVNEVNGSYEVLVKATLPAGATLKTIAFDAITQLNAKTQPSLLLGKNTVYVGIGEQTGSVVIWPELQQNKYQRDIVEEKNIQPTGEHSGYTGVLRSAKANEDAYIVYRLTTPGDMTRLTYGGRFYCRAVKGKFQVLYSLDEGKTWVTGFEIADTTPPWDVIRYAKVDVPAGHRSALVKYQINCAYPDDSGGGQSIFAVRMEANYKPADAALKPIEVTFDWSERQKDKSLVRRSHTQLVEKVPFTYTINVGGDDHPVVNSLAVNLKGAVKEVKYGYSDGKDVGGEKFVGRWVTYGQNFAEGKPYTVSVPPLTPGESWGAGDADGKKLTDGVVGAPYTGGATLQDGAAWKEGQQPVITVDLGENRKCGAFRIQLAGYPYFDAMVGDVKDKVEVLTSTDGKQYLSQGLFNFTYRWRDIPVNRMWPDDETFQGENFPMVLEQPVEARYVQFKLTPGRIVTVSEVQVLDGIKYAPFDLRIALPDGKDRSDITQYLPKHTPSKPYTGRAK